MRRVYMQPQLDYHFPPHHRPACMPLEGAWGRKGRGVSRVALNQIKDPKTRSDQISRYHLAPVSNAILYKPRLWPLLQLWYGILVPPLAKNNPPKSTTSPYSTTRANVRPEKNPLYTEHQRDNISPTCTELPAQSAVPHLMARPRVAEAVALSVSFPLRLVFVFLA